ncbi:MAG: YggS family pyridoxal phosphate-dependent enzyme [Armatimonadetes bacterium]|nr:YggS family pyridoxal phosphate-dependent enzyme [Armatimonadota bacterium]
MSPIAENVERVRKRIAAAARRAGRKPEAIRLVAATKGVEAERVRLVVAAGAHEIGENYVQEAAAKFAALADLSTTRHLIGHLQRNKAGRAAELFDCVQSVDSEPLAHALGRRAVALGRTVEALLEVNIAGEASKWGVAPEEAPRLAEAVASIPGLSLVGLMGMGPLGADEAAVRACFRQLAGLFERLPLPQRRVLSMGMSGDFEIAIEEGSTMVRIGTALFGQRRVTG